MTRKRKEKDVNDLVREEKHLPPKSTPIVTNVYFSDFMVQ